MESSKINAAIFYLTQNTDVRKTHLKTSLYFLFKNFNARYRYPVVVLHEGDFDNRAQQEVIMSVRSSCRSLITFVQLEKDDFVVPAFIDQEKVKNIIDLKPVPYWRNMKYRLMCRWWMVHMPKYGKGYDYIMRMDDDSIIEEPIKRDLFGWMNEKQLVYASNLIHVDCGMCCYGMLDFFKSLFPGREEHIQKLFVNNEVETQNLHDFRSVISIATAPNVPEIREKMPLPMPIMYYNNFHITKPAFWLREDVQKTIDAIDKNGSIFYYRWGDAPLQSILVALHAKENEISRCQFKYSKRLQREAFHGDDGLWYAFMPDTYEKTSCITEDVKG
jgi:hypothetical protein